MKEAESGFFSILQSHYTISWAMCFVTGDFKGQKGKSLISKKTDIRYISEL